MLHSYNVQWKFNMCLEYVVVPDISYGHMSVGFPKPICICSWHNKSDVDTYLIPLVLVEVVIPNISYGHMSVEFSRAIICIRSWHNKSDVVHLVILNSTCISSRCMGKLYVV